MGRRDKHAAAGATAGTDDAAAAPAHAAAPPPERPAPGPPPPPGGGPWVWVDLPEGAGTVLARAIRWRRTRTGAWALSVAGPRWLEVTAWTGTGGWEPRPVEEYQVVPAACVRRIDGQDYSRLPREQ